MKKQGGSILIYGVIVVAIVAAVGAAFYSYNNAIRNAERLEAEVEKLKKTIATQEDQKKALQEVVNVNRLAIRILEAEKAQLQEINSKRQVRTQTVAAKEKKTDEKLVLTLTKEPNSKAWADVYVPDAIVASLRDNDTADKPSSNEDGSGKAASPKGAASEDTYTWLAGENDQLGATKSSEGMEGTST